MTFEAVAGFSEIFSMILFVTLFAIVVAYALWPGNAAKFEHAARVPLQADASAQNSGAADER
jgi:cytochrome c oxidase cbb3-type subunit IV